MAIQSGYCTNVHAGADLAQTRANLERYAVAVKERFSPEAPLGIGLWLSASAARKLYEENRILEFSDWLADHSLAPFTLNGFPYGDFHQEVVKHNVYLPTWWEPARFEYTCNLIAIMDGLFPEESFLSEGSISTLPISWGHPVPQRAQLEQAADALIKIAHRLRRHEEATERLIYLCLEPEPGCYLQRSSDVVRYFKEYLLLDRPTWEEKIIRRYLRICHDVCHAAVMFEEQADVLNRYRDAGLAVGKIQVSSAVALSFDQLPENERAAALEQLRGFDEPRYLHQTMVRPNGREPTFFEDLHLALAGDEAQRRTGEWRIHFHVPIYLRRFGRLEAMQDAILSCLKVAREQQTTSHFEVETYAWGVLPAELQQPNLAAGIAEEMRWFREAWGQIDR